MATGTVKWFDQKKGYGLITPSDGGEDVFVRIAAVERSPISQLNQGQRINYRLASDPLGPRAVDLARAV